MQPRYAIDTKVTAAQTRSEIERLVSKYGATGYAYGQNTGRVMVGFEMCRRRVRFLVAMPNEWRALLLTIKAKLEAVAGGIEEFDDAFMAQIVLPTGETMGERSRPLIAQAYESGKVPPLLEHLG